MSKELIYKMPYEQDGKIKTIDFKISFVPNGFIKRYNEIMADSFFIKTAWDEMSDLSTKMSALKVEKVKGYKEKIEELQKQYDSDQEVIMCANDLDIEKKRFEIVSILLKKNGYNQEYLHDFSFWEWQVEPGIILDFMSQVAFKDIDLKKKVVR